MVAGGELGVVGRTSGSGCCVGLVVGSRMVYAYWKVLKMEGIHTTSFRRRRRRRKQALRIMTVV
jgi:hypothetical protein